MMLLISENRHYVNHHVLPDINFNEHCFINNNISIPKKVINLYISHRLNPRLRNLILVQNFHLQVKAWEKASLFLEPISAHLWILIIKIKISLFLVKDQHKD